MRSTNSPLSLVLALLIAMFPVAVLQVRVEAAHVHSQSLVVHVHSDETEAAASPAMSPDHDAAPHSHAGQSQGSNADDSAVCCGTVACHAFLPVSVTQVVPLLQIANVRWHSATVQAASDPSVRLKRPPRTA